MMMQSWWDHTAVHSTASRLPEDKCKDFVCGFKLSIQHLQPQNYFLEALPDLTCQCSTHFPTDRKQRVRLGQILNMHSSHWYPLGMCALPPALLCQIQQQHLRANGPEVCQIYNSKHGYKY